MNSSGTTISDVRTTKATYVVPGSDCTLLVATPATEPQLWDAYLRGAERCYRKFGVESALELDEIRDGLSTSLFLVAVSAEGEVVGGVRAQGPYRMADEAHAPREWDGFPGQAELREMIADRISEGVVEMKAAWISDDHQDRKAIALALTRNPLDAVRTELGARYVIATAGTDHIIKLWCSAGGVVAEHIPTAPYPSDRYRATPIWWDLATSENSW